ncbi:MAG: hypothetical protein HXX11_10925 [Desulfuromonadales bacterium]|nr:hypothetical protein [Desulfuromonadales bacterium]
MLESRRKRYLSGSDWVITALDHLLKATTCSGNICQVVLQLDSVLDEAAFRAHLNRFAAQFPVLQGRVTRDMLLAPYWKIPSSLKREISLQVSPLDDLSSSRELLPELIRIARLPFRDEHEHIAFHLFSDSRRSALVMRFDHRLFDARGAESFLNRLQQSLHDPNPDGPMSFRSSIALTGWRRKFQAGTNVNRRIIALSRSTPRALPLRTGPDKSFGYRLLCFDQRETAAMYDKADRMAGYLMESPFILAAVTLSLHDLFDLRSDRGESYLVPVTMDLRTGREPLKELFFNHVSYLFYQVPVQLGANLGELVTQFKQQMYDQVKSGFARDLAEASLLSRIAPLPLMGRLMHVPLKGKMASFVFSHLGRSAFQSPEFMGRRVDNLLHLPRVPAPPGLGFFSSLFNDRLTLCIAHLDGLLEEQELDLLERALRRNLGAEPS